MNAGTTSVMQDMDSQRESALEGMLPHHQGAVDMARVELAYGHDPRLRQLARSIIAAQEHEIGIMHAWLKAHPAAS